MQRFNSPLRAGIGKRLTRLGLESFCRTNLKDANGITLDVGVLGIHFVRLAGGHSFLLKLFYPLLISIEENRNKYRRI